jgi:hypothetical protein
MCGVNWKRDLRALPVRESILLKPAVVRRPRFIKDTFQDCKRLRIESRVAKFKYLARLAPGGAARTRLGVSLGRTLESDQHYEERREAFKQGYGIIDPTPMSIRRSPP